jgi:hypothetical protein
LGQGKEKAAAFLAAEPALEREIRERVTATLTTNPRAATTTDEEVLA